MKTVGFSSPRGSSDLRKLLDSLEIVLDLRFKECSFKNDSGIDAWIFFDADWDITLQLNHYDRPCFSILRKNQQVQCGDSSFIEFSRHSILPSVLNGRKVTTKEAVNLMSLPNCQENMTVLASKSGAPIWVSRDNGVSNHHIVSLQIPKLTDDDPLFQHFNGMNFIQLLPLLLFLRDLTDDKSWEPPPLQASFMFDDPNLHWRTYGFIKFDKVLQDAIINNYHVSFAMIPQDTWFVHKPTADLFRQHYERISLLIHGNNHSVQELAQTLSDGEYEQLLRQALWRISEFERRYGIEISKVMAPPHGACTERVLEKMAIIGFEAATISNGSLRRYNSQASWLQTLGMNPSDIIKGLPVFPRFPISGSCQNSILIAALLHQPIIPVGHHIDVSEGVQLLTNLSEFVNSLGNVQWANMKRISRSHFAQKLDGKILQIKMFTRLIEVIVPDGINKILVNQSRMQDMKSYTLLWRLRGKDLEWKIQHPDEPISVLPGQNIEIIYQPEPQLVTDQNYNRKIRLWPVLRRQLTEVRDRMLPLRKIVSSYLGHISNN